MLIALAVGVWLTCLLIGYMGSILLDLNSGILSQGFGGLFCLSGGKNPGYHTKTCVFSDKRSGLFRLWLLGICRPIWSLIVLSHAAFPSESLGRLATIKSLKKKKLWNDPKKIVGFCFILWNECSDTGGVLGHLQVKEIGYLLIPFMCPWNLPFVLTAPGIS